mgnify:CR=1 FL=1
MANLRQSKGDLIKKRKPNSTERGIKRNKRELMFEQKLQISAGRRGITVHYLISGVSYSRRTCHSASSPLFNGALAVYAN